jgi:hypothetical protein
MKTGRLTDPTNTSTAPAVDAAQKHKPADQP